MSVWAKADLSDAIQVMTENPHRLARPGTAAPILAALAENADREYPFQKSRQL
jgi:hypothetical protein